jgi:hypothetical protein
MICSQPQCVVAMARERRQYFSHVSGEHDRAWQSLGVDYVLGVS